MRITTACELCARCWQKNSYIMLHFVKKVVYAHLTYRDVKRFWNESVHEFYGFKAREISKVHATSC